MAAIDRLNRQPYLDYAETALRILDEVKDTLKATVPTLTDLPLRTEQETTVLYALSEIVFEDGKKQGALSPLQFKDIREFYRFLKSNENDDTNLIKAGYLIKFVADYNLEKRHSRLIHRHANILTSFKEEPKHEMYKKKIPLQEFINNELDDELYTVSVTKEFIVLWKTGMFTVDPVHFEHHLFAHLDLVSSWKALAMTYVKSIRKEYIDHV